jgi:hypothetical protein
MMRQLMRLVDGEGEGRARRSDALVFNNGSIGWFIRPQFYSNRLAVVPRCLVENRNQAKCSTTSNQQQHSQVRQHSNTAPKIASNTNRYSHLSGLSIQHPPALVQRQQVQQNNTTRLGSDTRADASSASRPFISGILQIIFHSSCTPRPVGCFACEWL